MLSHTESEMFGDPADFAIEAGADALHTASPYNVWGHMRVWCAGHPLGNIEDRHCGLNHSYLAFKYRSDNLDDLWSTEFHGLDDHALWNFLDERLYGYHGDVEIEDHRSLEELQRDAKRFGKFDFLTNWGEQFDNGYKSFLFCPPNNPLRILSRAFPESIGLGVSISRTGFVQASQRFLHWYEHEERRLKTQTR